MLNKAHRAKNAGVVERLGIILGLVLRVNSFRRNIVLFSNLKVLYGNKIGLVGKRKYIDWFNESHFCYVMGAPSNFGGCP